jgi:hypothetical protein
VTEKLQAAQHSNQKSAKSQQARQIAVDLQVNTSVGRSLGKPLSRVIVEVMDFMPNEVNTTDTPGVAIERAKRVMTNSNSFQSD